MTRGEISIKQHIINMLSQPGAEYSIDQMARAFTGGKTHAQNCVTIKTYLSDMRSVGKVWSNTSTFNGGKPFMTKSVKKDGITYYHHVPEIPAIASGMDSSPIKSADTDDSGDWSKNELRAAVDVYLEMQRKERDGEPFAKKRYYENLAKAYGRTEKAFEYRMQNISYVLSLMGRDWLTGLMPAKNVGAKIAAEIEELIGQLEGKKSLPVVGFEIAVRKAARKTNQAEPTGSQNPQTTISEVSQFKRDAAVKAWVLNQANGTCECCDNEAPFDGTDGLPYLEVHHVRKLADLGSDTIYNAVALCPNCHRELHHGAKSRELVEQLYERVARLIRE